MRTFKQKQRPIMPIIALAVVIGAVLVMVWVIMDRQPGTNRPAQGQHTEVTQDDKSGSQKTDTLPGAVVKQITKPAVIDYNELVKDGIIKDLMESRKKDLGVKDSVDIVVKSNETFTVGENTTSMEKVIEQAFAGKNKVLEKELDESGAQKPVGLATYGIYVVQPGDNIWNIHFRILKEYYTRKGIHLGKKADEPNKRSGMSSGVGKILKFSETMVITYNLKEKKITADLNIIDPLSKVVIYNMDEVFALLEQINLNHVDKLRFDGSNIWIPVR